MEDQKASSGQDGGVIHLRTTPHHDPRRLDRLRQLNLHVHHLYLHQRGVGDDSHLIVLCRKHEGTTSGDDLAALFVDKIGENGHRNKMKTTVTDYEPSMVKAGRTLRSISVTPGTACARPSMWSSQEAKYSVFFNNARRTAQEALQACRHRAQEHSSERSNTVVVNVYVGQAVSVS